MSDEFLLYYDPLQLWERALACSISREGDKPKETEITFDGTQIEVLDELHSVRKPLIVTAETNGDGCFRVDGDEMPLVGLISFIQSTFSQFKMTIREKISD
jgi:hypothetical protein